MGRLVPCVAAAALVVGAACTGGSQAGDGSVPNVLLIVTDDQRIDTMRFMPKTRAFFVGGGTNFVSAFATTPQCCPSRASILTGRYAHNHGVRSNYDAENLDESTGFPRMLQDAGYRTAIAGKYLNRPGEGYFDRPNAGIDPPNFDDWVTFLGGYHEPLVNDNGNVDIVDTYSTTLVEERAVSWLEEFEDDDDRPWLLYLAPFAPHAPAEPEERYARVSVDAPENEALEERNLSDKPPFVRDDLIGPRDSRRAFRKHVRTLFSVDDLVGSVAAALDRHGETEDTLAIFVSDNGLLVGENDTFGKGYPYTYATQIPLAIRWPGHVGSGRSDRRIAANIDIAPTIVDAAGITPNPTYPMDGRSLLAAEARSKFLNEAWTSRGAWASIRTPSYQYVEYYDITGSEVRFTEYYDLVEDPSQLTNRLGDANPRNDPFTDPLHRELLQARQCAGDAACFAALQHPGVPSVCRGARNEGGHHMVGSEIGDRIRGISSKDVACGLEGKDVIRAQGGNDLVLGGEGRDVLWGGSGNDTIVGKGGRDVCRGGPGRDRFRGCERERG